MSVFNGPVQLAAELGSGTARDAPRQGQAPDVLLYRGAGDLQHQLVAVSHRTNNTLFFPGTGCCFVLHSLNEDSGFCRLGVYSHQIRVRAIRPSRRTILSSKTNHLFLRGNPQRILCSIDKKP